jgi:hypothetical protein
MKNFTAHRVSATFCPVRRFGPEYENVAIFVSVEEFTSQIGQTGFGKNPMLRLGGAMLLLCLAGNSASTPFGEASAVIAVPQKILSSNEIDRVDPANADAAITEYAYDVQFMVTNRLAGPDLGRTARISLIDGEDLPQKLFMVVRRDGLGRLWARRAWQEVGSRLCLSAQQVDKLNLTAAFARASHNEKGQRCISI